MFATITDGPLRFCVKYWKLNDVEVEDASQILQMEECLESLGEARIFLQLGLAQGSGK